MKEYDLHIHTKESHDSNLEPEVLIKNAIDAELDGIAITNHGAVAGVEDVREFSEPFDLEVVPGAEVRSEDFGDILCLYIDRVPENDGSAEDIIRSVQEKGGIAIIAHPFARRTVDFRGADGRLFKKADAIEAVNSRNIFDSLNDDAYTLAKELDMPVTGGSDTHFEFEVGRGRTVFPDDMTLREAIANNKTKATGEGGNVSSHVARAVDEIKDLF